MAIIWQRISVRGKKIYDRFEALPMKEIPCASCRDFTFVAFGQVKQLLQQGVKSGGMEKKKKKNHKIRTIEIIRSQSDTNPIWGSIFRRVLSDFFVFFFYLTTNSREGRERKTPDELIFGIAISFYFNPLKSELRGKRRTNPKPRTFGRFTKVTILHEAISHVMYFVFMMPSSFQALCFGVFCFFFFFLLPSTLFSKNFRANLSLTGVSHDNAVTAVGTNNFLSFLQL